MDITNLGNINIENLEALFFVPIVSPNYEKAIGIVTAGEMHIVVPHDWAQIGSETIEAFTQRSIDHLSDAIAATTTIGE